MKIIILTSGVLERNFVNESGLMLATVQQLVEIIQAHELLYSIYCPQSSSQHYYSDLVLQKGKSIIPGEDVIRQWNTSETLRDLLSKHITQEQKELYVICDEDSKTEGETLLNCHLKEGTLITIKREESSNQLEVIERSLYEMEEDLHVIEDEEIHSKFSFSNALSRFFQNVLENIIIPAWKFTFTGNKKSKRPFLDYFLGLPSAYSDDDGEKIHLSTARKILIWTAYCLGGFILRPLQNIAKFLIQMPPWTIAFGCSSLYNHLDTKIKSIKKQKRPTKVLSLISGLVTFPALLIMTFNFVLINPILSPINNIKLCLKIENKKTGENKLLSRILTGISVTVTTLFYGSLIALTAGFAIPLIAPGITVPGISAMVSGLSSLFGGSTAAAAATATAASSLPLLALVSNGVQTAAKNNNNNTESIEPEDDILDPNLDAKTSVSSSHAQIGEGLSLTSSVEFSSQQTANTHSIISPNTELLEEWALVHHVQANRDNLLVIETLAELAVWIHQEDGRIKQGDLNPGLWETWKGANGEITSQQSHWVNINVWEQVKRKDLTTDYNTVDWYINIMRAMGIEKHPLPVYHPPQASTPSAARPS